MNKCIDPEYMTIKQIAQYASLGIRTIRQFVNSPEHPIPHYRVNRKTLRISRNDFDKWIELYRVNTKDQLDELVNSVLRGL